MPQEILWKIKNKNQIIRNVVKLNLARRLVFLEIKKTIPPAAVVFQICIDKEWSTMLERINATERVSARVSRTFKKKFRLCQIII